MSEFEDNVEARTAYEARHPFYERLAREVRDILEGDFRSSDFKPVLVTQRAKEVGSFVEKITRKNYSDPLAQMTDLAGVRVVCAYEAEIASVAKIIETKFQVVERVDKADQLGTDRMGYNGKAFVVTLGDSYRGGRYEGITELKCEIQVRTILQDAWAVIDHQLVYKNEEATPVRLRRDLNNVASLLEIAQGIFDSIKKKRSAYEGEIKQKESDSKAFLAQRLDFDTAMAYSRWKFPDKDASERITQLLLRDINLKSYPTLQQLNDAVDRAKEAVAAYQKEKPDWFNSGTDFLTKSLGFVDEDFRKKHGFAPKTRAAFDKFQHLIR